MCAEAKREKEGPMGKNIRVEGKKELWLERVSAAWGVSHCVS